jgi:hypothetical protein
VTSPAEFQRIVSAEILAGKRRVRVLLTHCTDSARLAEEICAALDRGALRVQLQQRKQPPGEHRAVWTVVREWNAGDLVRVSAWRAGQGRRKKTAEQVDLFAVPSGANV